MAAVFLLRPFPGAAYESTMLELGVAGIKSRALGLRMCSFADVKKQLLLTGASLKGQSEHPEARRVSKGPADRGRWPCDGYHCRQHLHLGFGIQAPF